MLSVRCARALLPEGWAENVVVGVDAHGRIDAVGVGAEAKADLELAGWVVPASPPLRSHAVQRDLAERTDRSQPGVEDSFAYGLADALDLERASTGGRG